MRFIVEQKHTVRSRKTIRLSGWRSGKSLHKVELGADSPRRTGRRCIDRADDVLGGADQVGLCHDLVRALGMDQHVDVRDRAPHVVHRVGA